MVRAAVKKISAPKPQAASRPVVTPLVTPAPIKRRSGLLKKEFAFPFGAAKEKELFAENVAMLVESGMGMLAVVRAIKYDVKSAAMRQTVARLERDIEGGSSLWAAFERANLFPGHIISLIRVGEHAGRLSENLRVIAKAQEKEREFRSRIRSAMIYPVFVLTLTLLIGTGISWFILPNLANVFTQLDIDLPLISRIMLGVGSFLGVYGSIVVPLFLACVAVALFFLFVFHKTKFIGQSMLFHMPGIRRVMQEVELSRMGYIMGSLLGAGLPLVHALQATGSAATLRPYRTFYAGLAADINDGLTFQQSFGKYPNAKYYMYPALQHLLVAGEHSGKLEQGFAKIGEIYSSKTETTTKNLAVILEPILLVVVWLGVLGVALAVILPIYGLIGGFEVDPSVVPPAEEAVVQDGSTVYE